MDKAEAKRTACGIVNALIDSYRGVGQPLDDYLGEIESGQLEASASTLADLNRLNAAICEIQNEMMRRAGKGFPATVIDYKIEDLENE